ncbi:MAG: Uncharacterized protein UR17_C0001G0938 [Candidatus Woesebacteria bacterium GW2011_GWF1_31_35]|nr:MAG: Uncharacterized protein UR17_C0001G0938 [Candidatus Woesebacteria bacterium GW2011_GWF1_31_35]OGM72443.1 MAG: hypothetical protein A2185_03525 [Candidatus Woesebacteria bacterium RIFOXYA1_FULL_31_71]OGM85288.1 MAG: hypothetical protein A2595_03545 [Candidatus Woesebacteria bacterium RIFOXYD1_FULL_31_53]HBP39641.1 hypothetical protein [Candidatus Woesebacteria bacterium]
MHTSIFRLNMSPKLSDYFQPLNIRNILIFIIMIFFFDVVGTFIKKYFIKNRQLSDNTRILNWLIGFGFFIFLWFLAGFLIRPTQLVILISATFILVLTLPWYIKNKEYVKLIKQVKILFPFLIIVIPLLPAVFVKASLPPYYSDEMAYHFISPYTANYQLADVWRFDGGVLNNAPRLIDTFFVLGFSLTKTYSIVRLTLFSILITSIVFVGHFLRKRLNLFTGIFFVLLFFSLPQDIVFTSTVGFVDISAYALFILGLIFSSLNVLEKKNKFEILILATIFLAMSLGTKYTIITAFIPIVLALLIFNFSIIKKLFTKKYIKNIVYLTLIFLMFGGYWYIKNIIIYGNPIYPFLFPCWGKYAMDCNTGASFFGEWTTKINLVNIKSIILSLIPGGKPIVIMALLSTFSIFCKKFVKEKKLVVFYLFIFIFELISLRLLSGFYIRYHQHMQILILLSITISSYIFIKSNMFPKFVKIIVAVLFLLSIIRNYIIVVNKTNSLVTLTWNEINYSIGKDDIYNWIKFRLPRVYDAVIWCENPPGGIVSLARYDPDMIWYDDEGYMRSFLINCYYGGQTLDTTSLETIKSSAIEKKIEFWTVTPSKCIEDKEVKSKYWYEGPKETKMRHDNNFVVCNSTQIKENLFFFSYKALNEK